MDLFEQLNPFVRFSQIVGFIPFGIDTSNLRKKFSFSWCHFITFWFILTFVFALSPVIGYVLLHNYQTSIGNSTRKVPFSFTIVFVITLSFHAIMIFMSRFISLRYYELRRVTNSLTTGALKMLEKLEGLPGLSNTLRRRTFIGIFFILLAVNI